ncbi:MAG: penicillin-binding protein 2 [Candidatus Thermofonsia Clade 3 bacterium]|jgi:penicillin-binding protein 2|uniref:Penicillin-binding protein 2 n=1 Tax=Candidatus Thermofonsia Clade 3 bacterium TaxID=2364212 RepID=A0A2M8QCH4_9CHLR|nr:penicillin-binding protein 2 [Candidatus Roseilinea sp. NK_OTU-006]PJF47478.1 MAG: penicillin-binding protein 2 [Candidatus Thermofonsia Clade 3 bacterium]
MLLDDIPIRRRTSQTPPPDNEGGRVRLMLLGFGVILTFIVLGIRLFDLQVNRQALFSAQVERRSIIERALPATRGLIYDRNGELLVRNAPAYQIAIIPIQQVRYKDDPIRQRVERMAMYNKLAAMINQPGVTAGEIYTKVVSQNALIAPYQPTVIADNVPREVALAIQEQSLIMRGVVVQTVGSREYPYKELLGNILGYTGKIFREMIEREPEKFSREIYDYDNDRVGITGVERAVEEKLRGRKGKRTVLVDASFEELQVLSETPPVNGNSVRLTIDLRLQQIISDVLISAMKERGAPRGAVVALNPNTGEILAMVSAPSYDNNWFAQGISQQRYEALANDPHKPLLNHATQDRVPPGSTFKIVTAAALLQEGAVNERTLVFDPGIFILPDQYDPTNPDKGQKFYCWKRTGHGFQNIRDALRNSCDTYFYKTVGGFADGKENIPGMGPDKLAQWAQEFGIGETTELNIDYSVGIAPTKNWKLRNIGEVWSTGDSYNAAIGQGYVLATPLEMANVTAAIANGGTLYHPQIVKDVLNERGEVIQPFTPKVKRQIRLDPYYIQLIQDALWRVVNEPGGTAWGSRLEGFEYAGKTGTAEFCDDVAYQTGICYTGIQVLPTHAWFVSYAPAQNPQIAMAVYVWNGGQGSGVAAPITQRIYNRYFNIGVPEDKLAPIQQGDSE